MMIRKSEYNGIKGPVLWVVFFCFLVVPVFPRTGSTSDPRLSLKTTVDPSTGHRVSRGVFRVPENRDTGEGRTLSLNLVVLHATGKNPQPFPLFVLAGGPGVPATVYEAAMKSHRARKYRDIVLVALRGTGGDNRLHCPLNRKGDLQGYMDSSFQMDIMEDCLEKLSRHYDLTQYSTPVAVDDLEEIRRALGYGKINLIGYSGGTRTALVYMRRHPDSIRAAILNGVVPMAFKNPLFHASAAQDSIEMLFDQCRKDPVLQGMYPDLERKFTDILRRLSEKPVTVPVKDRTRGETVEVVMDRNDFAEAVRFMLYNLRTNRKLPHLIQEAHRGHYQPFAQVSVDNARGLDQILSMGLLLCVTCAEDVDRITEEEIRRETADTFLGDTRVREQKAVCAIWPRSRLPEDFADPVITDIPVLLLSGTMDPVTPSRFAEALHRRLKYSLHLVVPGVHGVGGPCLEEIQMRFLETADVDSLDTSCIGDISLPPVYRPEDKTEIQK